MGSKYQSYTVEKGIPRELRNRIHPIWRGIGFLLLVLIPLLGYISAVVLLDLNGQNNWFPLPYDLMARPGQLLYAYFPDPMLYIKLLIAFCFSLLFYIVFTFITFLIISSFGVSYTKRDPYYVPPVQRRRRKP